VVLYIYRDKQIVDSCEEMLKVWLIAYNCDPLQFLSGLEPEHNEEVAELALKHIFSLQTIDLNRFKTEQIDFNFAFFWRVYCQWVKETKVIFSF
jgi:hypothetical protein